VGFELIGPLWGGTVGGPAPPAKKEGVEVNAASDVSPRFIRELWWRRDRERKSVKKTLPGVVYIGSDNVILQNLVPRERGAADVSKEGLTRTLVANLCVRRQARSKKGRLRCFGFVSEKEETGGGEKNRKKEQTGIFGRHGALGTADQE